MPARRTRRPGLAQPDVEDPAVRGRVWPPQGVGRWPPAWSWPRGRRGTGADPRPGRPRGQHRGHAARSADAAGGEHRDPYRLEDLLQQRQRRDVVAAVAAALAAARDEQVDATLLGGDRLRQRARLGRDDGPGGLQRRRPTARTVRSSTDTRSGACSVTTSSSASSCASAHAISPTPYGPAARATEHSARTHSRDEAGPTPIIPSPPAPVTAAASRPVLTPAIGAATTGTVRPNRSVSQVRKGIVLPVVVVRVRARRRRSARCGSPARPAAPRRGRRCRPGRCGSTA